MFSKLDVKDAFWHVRLDEASSKLTAMATPYGRYVWKRLPFGLKVSSEIFQRKLAEAIGDLEVICVADDIVICGCGATKQEAEDDHNRKMSALKRRCEEKHILLNEKKQQLLQTEVTFLGHRIGKDGIKADPGKVEAIMNMEAPSDVHEVKRFCGMAQYLARFLPKLADDVEPLRKLTKKDAEWRWTEECQTAFETVKAKVTRTPVLGYFSPEKTLELQVDSSDYGLGATLLQDGRPLEYASRLLTPSERNWSQMEKELLAVVFGLTRFHQYTFGRPVLVLNDHKPLETILKKPLSKAPRRLQNLMLQVFQYDAIFKYEKGETLHIADFLSRAPIKTSVHAIGLDEGMEDDMKRFPDKLILEVQTKTEADPVMSDLLKYIRRGWPAKKDVPASLQPYFSIRDRLSCQGTLILMGERILIPPVMRSNIKKKLHSAHMGADSMIRRATQSVFWPGLRHEIKQMADSCEACAKFKPNNQKEPLKPQPVDDRPWSKVGVDLCELYGRTYLITVDFYSSFVEVDAMTSTSSADVVRKLKAHCARYGIFKELVTDQGPQFTSSAFRKWVCDWHIVHTMSSPYHHQGNGRAESAVKVVKNMLKRTLLSHGDQFEALLELRNTPRQDTGASPAQLVFGRTTRAFIPVLRYDADISKEDLRRRRNRRQAQVKNSFDRTTRKLPRLSPNQPVWFQKHGSGSSWSPAKIRGASDRSYQIEADDGAVLIRNRVHLRPKMDEDHLTERPTAAQPEHRPTTNVNEDQARPTASPETSCRLRRGVRERRPPRWMNDYVE